MVVDRRQVLMLHPVDLVGRVVEQRVYPIRLEAQLQPRLCKATTVGPVRPAPFRMAVTAVVDGEVLEAWLTDRVVVEVVDLDRTLCRRGWVQRERLSEQSDLEETVARTRL